MTDHILPNHDGSQPITRADSESHAGYSREADTADWMNWREPDPLSLKRLVVRPASPLVNNVKNDGPELLEGSVVIWPITGASDEKGVKIKVGFVEPMLSLPVAKLPRVQPGRTSSNSTAIARWASRQTIGSNCSRETGRTSPSASH
jgi:hypothetical protein